MDQGAAGQGTSGQGQWDRSRRAAYGKALAVLLAAVVAAIAGFGLWSHFRQADTSHTAIEISDSAKFTRAQLDDAGAVLLKDKRSYKGCTIDRISYDEQWSDDRLGDEWRSVEDNPGSDSSFHSAIAQYGMDKVLIFRSDFTCDGASDKGFSTGTTAGWEDLLAWAPADAKADRGWVRIDGGF